MCRLKRRRDDSHNSNATTDDFVSLRSTQLPECRIPPFSRPTKPRCRSVSLTKVSVNFIGDRRYRYATENWAYQLQLRNATPHLVSPRVLTKSSLPITDSFSSQINASRPLQHVADQSRNRPSLPPRQTRRSQHLLPCPTSLDHHLTPQFSRRYESPTRPSRSISL